MTEQEWLEYTDFEALDENLWLSRTTLRAKGMSDRKLLLFCCACCRRTWSLLTDQRSKHALETAEKYADRLVGQRTLNQAGDEANKIAAPGTDDTTDAIVCVCFPSNDWETNLSTMGHIANKMRLVASYRAPDFDATHTAESVAQCSAVRDIFGNPFQPIVTIDPTWLTATVKQLAETIYTGRAFGRLPILADALEEAGCTDPLILGHCRGPGPHVRGCWVVDLLLGKE